MKILVTDGIDKAAKDQLESYGHAVIEHSYAPEQLGTALRQFDAVIIRSATQIDQTIIDACQGSRLKWILRAGVGLDNIAVSYAKDHGIGVFNTPQASAESVAELAMAHIFSCARYISICGQQMRQDRWEKKACGHGIEILGKTLGIIGYGRIGQTLGRMAQALGMRVLAYDISRNDAFENSTMKYVDLDELLAQSDFVSLHTPSLDGKPLVDAPFLQKMKDGAIFINTSRGNNVDEQALLNALNTGKIRAAGLDVYAQEPAKNHALYAHPCVSCTPHIGAATEEAQQRIGAELVEIVQNVQQSLSNLPIATSA